MGAGTSGRIAVQDGVELYPTFGWPKNRIDFIIAGGEKVVSLDQLRMLKIILMKQKGC